jgi:hypothetical protein
LSPPMNKHTRSPNASRRAAAVAGKGDASGTNTIARRPAARQAATASTQITCSSSGAGRKRKVEDAREPIASETSDPREYVRSASAGKEAAAGGSDRSEAEGRSEAPPHGPPPVTASPPSSDATRGGDILPSTVASGATYRSDIHRASDNIGPSKNRTGDTTVGTGSIREGRSVVGPSTHPRVSLPWNRTRTSDPRPAPSSAASS